MESILQPVSAVIVNHNAGTLRIECVRAALLYLLMCTYMLHYVL